MLTFPKRIKEKQFCQTQFSLGQMVDFSDILHLPSAIIYVKLTLAKRKSIYLIWRPILDLNVSNISLMTHTTKQIVLYLLYNIYKNRFNLNKFNLLSKSGVFSSDFLFMLNIGFFISANFTMINKKLELCCLKR